VASERAVFTARKALLVNGSRAEAARNSVRNVKKDDPPTIKSFKAPWPLAGRIKENIVKDTGFCGSWPGT
jgi:hypothetical protein